MPELYFICVLLRQQSDAGRTFVVMLVWTTPLLLAALRISGLERGIAALASTNGVVQIDAENVRGKSGFKIGHQALLAATAEWTEAHGLRGRVVVQVDHGKAHQGFYVAKHGFGVTFSGPQQKADGVMAVVACSS